MTARPLQLLHLTDLHLCADADARLHGWRVEQAFETVLTAAIRRYPDYDALVLGGDLVDDESVTGYRRLDRRLAALGRPVLAMAGNHDDPAAMRRCLESAHVHTTMDLGAWRLIALDSHRDDSEAGRLGDRQRTQLAAQLEVAPTPTLVFVHHPPVAIGSAWIDAIGLADGEELVRLLACHTHVRALVCGHAHQARHLPLGATDGWITPSTMRQFLPRSDTFAEDSKRAPGYRWIELGADTRVMTRVHRVPLARANCG